MATRADNLAYLLRRSREPMKGPAFMEDWHNHWQHFGRGRGRPRRRPGRATIRKAIIDEYGTATIATRGTKRP